MKSCRDCPLGKVRATVRIFLVAQNYPGKNIEKSKPNFPVTKWH